MEDNRLTYLLKQYQANKLTEAEQEELNDWYHMLNFKNEKFDASSANKDLLYSDFKARLSESGRISVIRKYSTYAAAAIILFIISAGLWFMRKEPTQELVEVKPLQETMQPGGNKAFLTLADGSRISLTDASNGTIAEQTGIQITKADDGQLIYEVLDPVTGSGELKFNTIETPRGGQFQIVLPDGSRVWLNAASSLKYPVQFSGNERKVELQGEGYFEISADKTRPFKVVSNRQVIEVLGTHFNVSAYGEEKIITTTLLEGSVKLHAGVGISRTLKPGEQSELSQAGKLTVASVNTSFAVAWKDGKFIFRNEPLESVMRKLSRWYDVDVSYEQGVPGKTVWGNVSRFNNVTDILELIELSKVARFKIEQGNTGSKGRRIIVMK